MLYLATSMYDRSFMFKRTTGDIIFFNFFGDTQVLTEEDAKLAVKDYSAGYLELSPLGE